MTKNVAILGASANSSRYSYQAYQLLCEFKHNVFLVNPNVSLIEDQKVYKSLNEVHEIIDTLTIYVNKEISDRLVDQILKLKPKRVIFNPGSENPSLYPILKENEIEFEQACTLVLLRTGQF